MRNRFCLVRSPRCSFFSSCQSRFSLIILSWSRDRPSCGQTRLDKFHTVDSCRQLSVYGQTQKCSCKAVISVEYVGFCSGAHGAWVVSDLISVSYCDNCGTALRTTIFNPQQNIYKIPDRRWWLGCPGHTAAIELTAPLPTARQSSHLCQWRASRKVSCTSCPDSYSRHASSTRISHLTAEQKDYSVQSQSRKLLRMKRPCLSWLSPYILRRRVF